MQTIKSSLEWAGRQLSSIIDGEVLLGFVLGKDRTYLYTYPEQTLTDSQWVHFQACIENAKQGMPVAYQTGEKEFWSLSFKVTPSVLIPRADTELLVELALGLGLNAANVVDLGTGSGAIAMAIAHERPDWQVCATDLSEKSLEVATENLARLQLPNVSIVNGNWLDPFKPASFDLIVSNPPYIAPNDPHLQSLKYEPKSALVADEHGLACLAHIIKLAPSYLKAGGYLLLEHGFTQGAQVRAMMEQNGFGNVKTHQDLHGQDRATIGKFNGVV